MADFHENTPRAEPSGSVGTPILTVRFASARDLSVTDLEPAGQDGVWVALQTDAYGRLRVHDDQGAEEQEDLLRLTEDVRDDQRQQGQLQTELLRQVLMQLSILTGQEPDWGALGSAETGD